MLMLSAPYHPVTQYQNNPVYNTHGLCHVVAQYKNDTRVGNEKMKVFKISRNSGSAKVFLD